MLYTPIPQKNIGPLSLVLDGLREEIIVPLATFESPLWPSVARGAKLSRLSDEGIHCHVQKSCMTRSIAFEATSMMQAVEVSRIIKSQQLVLQEITEQTSSYCQLEDLYTEVVGSTLFLRFSFYTGLASGHNMATKAAQALQEFLLKTYPNLSYLSISGNLCCDKKVSAVNGFLGRGKRTLAELVLSRTLVEKHLRTTPERLEKLNWKKNHLGTNLAGTIRTANAHFANMLLAIYLATGQDAANIIEASQGFTLAETTSDGDLRFSVTLPNIIVGTIGNGKHHQCVEENLQLLGCTRSQNNTDRDARRLASIIAGTVLCGELSLLAAQTNPGELMKSHLHFERANVISQT